MKQRYSLNQRQVSARTAYRLYGAWMRFGWELMGRPLDIARDTGERMSDSAARGLFGGWAPRRVAEELAEDYVNLGIGLMSVPISAFGTAVAELDHDKEDAPEEIEQALSGTTPAPKARAIELDPMDTADQIDALAIAAGNTNTKIGRDGLAHRVATHFLLPARILDASQAWASWFIPLSKAQALLREAVDLGHQPSAVLDAFEPASVGKSEVMVSLLLSDYRASDFGVLREIGLTLSVTPKGQRFADPGQIFIRLIVSDPYSVGPARKIWGIRKDLWDNAAHDLEASYSEERVGFGIDGTSRDTLEITFPRFGKGRSYTTPSMIYSMAEPTELPSRAAAPVRSILTRDGEGEGVQFGGSVEVNLPESREVGQAAGCLCSNGMACLCDTLRVLGMNGARPAANGWCERMSGAFNGPAPILKSTVGEELPEGATKR